MLARPANVSRLPIYGAIVMEGQVRPTNQNDVLAKLAKQARRRREQEARSMQHLAHLLGFKMRSFPQDRQKENILMKTLVEIQQLKTETRAHAGAATKP